MILDMTGPMIVMALGCLGTAIGCGIACMELHSILNRTEKGFGLFFAIVASPLAQLAFPFAAMFLMKHAILVGTLSPEGATRIGLFVGLAMLGSAIIHGMCAKTVIQVVEQKPSVLAKALGSLIFVESASIALICTIATFWPIS